MSWLTLSALLMLQLNLPGEAQLQPEGQGVVLKEFISPITGESFTAPVLEHSVPVPSYDYDRCPHPTLNTLAYTLVIDPASGYAATPESFELAVPWSLSELNEILGPPKFHRSTPDGWPWAGAYAWEKFENAARLAEEMDELPLVIAGLWLTAAWSVRLDVISGHNEFDAEVARLFQGLPRYPANAGDLFTPPELQLADSWAAAYNSGELTDLDEARFCLALAWLYRSRGELTASRQWLAEAALHDPGLKDSSELYNFLTSSIELERSYLRVARDWMKAAYREELDPQAYGGTAFMLAECERRLGDRAQAIYWYQQAQQNNMGLLSSNLIEHLLALTESQPSY